MVASAGSGGATGAREASRAQVLVATVTPVAPRETDPVSALPWPTAAGATETPAETSTATAEAEPTQEGVVAAATPPDEDPTETPTAVPTETPTPAPSSTGTATSTATSTVTASPTATATPSPTATATSAPQVPATGFRATLLAGHNGVRSGVGVSNLTLSNALNQLAQERAETMASLDSMTHYNPDGSTVFDMMNAEGYSYGDGAENIAHNVGYSADRSVEVVMQQWIDSPSHYANIVKGHLRKVGFGMAVSASGKVYYSAVFSD